MKESIRSLLSVQPFWEGQKTRTYIMPDEWTGKALAVCYEIYSHPAHRGLTTVPGIGLIGMIFSIDPEYPYAICCGTLSKSKFVPHGNARHLMVCQFLPAEFKRIFGIPGTELTDREIPLDVLLPSRLTSDTIQRVSHAIDFTHAINIVRRYICALQERSDGRFTNYAAQLMTTYSLRKRGNVHVRDLEEKTGYSARYLQKLSLEYLGLTPKAAVGNMQFQHALRLLMEHPHMPVCDIGETCGYYDQSHFGRVFKGFVGMSPSAFQKANRHAPQSRL